MNAFEKHQGNSFLLFCWLKFCQLYYEISSFPEVLYKRDVPKNFSKFTDKHKKQSSGGVLSKDVLETFAKFTGTGLCRSVFLNKVASLKPETVRSSHWRCSAKKCVLKNFANFTGKNLCWCSEGLQLYRSSRPEVFCGKGALRNFENSQENSCTRVSFLIKLQVLNNFIKRYSDTGVFLWTLRNF